jgi:hypothetical protein
LWWSRCFKTNNHYSNHFNDLCLKNPLFLWKLNIRFDFFNVHLGTNMYQHSKLTSLSNVANQCLTPQQTNYHIYVLSKGCQPSILILICNFYVCLTTFEVYAFNSINMYVPLFFFSPKGVTHGKLLISLIFLTCIHVNPHCYVNAPTNKIIT